MSRGAYQGLELRQGSCTGGYMGISGYLGVLCRQRRLSKGYTVHKIGYLRDVVLVTAKLGSGFKV